MTTPACTSSVGNGYPTSAPPSFVILSWERFTRWDTVSLMTLVGRVQGEARSARNLPIGSNLAGAAAYAAWYGSGWGGLATLAPYAVNTAVEVASGRNVVGWLTYVASDAVTRRVLEQAQQAGIHPWATTTHNGYTFKVDQYCRTYGVSGYLSIRPEGRVYSSIKPLVTAPGDANGHLIGDYFGGPIVAYNLVAMTKKQNNSMDASKTDVTYKRMEAALKAIYNARNGGCVWVDIDVRYPAIPNWNTASPDRKLDFWRPTRLYVRAIWYQNQWLPCGARRTYVNPYILPRASGLAGVQVTDAGFDNAPPANYTKRTLNGYRR